MRRYQWREEYGQVLFAPQITNIKNRLHCVLFIEMQKTSTVRCVGYALGIQLKFVDSSAQFRVKIKAKDGTLACSKSLFRA